MLYHHSSAGRNPRRTLGAYDSLADAYMGIIRGKYCLPRGSLFFVRRGNVLGLIFADHKRNASGRENKARQYFSMVYCRFERNMTGRYQIHFLAVGHLPRNMPIQGVPGPKVVYQVYTVDDLRLVGKQIKTVYHLIGRWIIPSCAVSLLWTIDVDRSRPGHPSLRPACFFFQRRRE